MLFIVIIYPKHVWHNFTIWIICFSGGLYFLFCFSVTSLYWFAEEADWKKIIKNTVKSSNKHKKKINANFSQVLIILTKIYVLIIQKGTQMRKKEEKFHSQYKNFLHFFFPDDLKIIFSMFNSNRFCCLKQNMYREKTVGRFTHKLHFPSRANFYAFDSNLLVFLWIYFSFVVS